MSFKRGLFGLLTFFFASLSYSQKIDWKPSYRTFSILDGLPSSETYFVHQDRKGFIWFCTDRGIVKYDGFHTEVLTTKNGLPDNVIFWIYEDYKGRIWFVSYNGLLSYYENHRIVKYKYNHRISDYIGNNLYPFKTFSVDQNDNVFFSSGNNGILRIDKQGKTKLSIYKKDCWTFDLINGKYQTTFNLNRKREFPASFCQLTIRKNGVISKKIISHTIFKKQKQSSAIVELKLHQGIEIARIKDCFFDLRYPEKVAYFPGTTGYFPIGTDLWITTVNGAYKLKNIPKYGLVNAPRELFLQGFKVSSVFKDKEKGMWFSTLDKGIVYMPNSIVRNISIFENAKEIDVTHVVVDANKDVFYSNHLGVFRLKDHQAIILSNHISRNMVSRLDNKLLLAKDQKEKQIDLTGRNYWFIPNYYDNFNEQDTSMLICSSAVMRIYRTGKIDTLYDYFASEKYHKNLHHFFETVCSSHEGLVFAGNTKGLFCLKNGKWDHSMFPEAIRKNRVSCVRYSKELGLVIATRGDGIYCFKNGKIRQHITVENGLVSDQINKIYLEKNGVVCWVATNKGVSKLFFVGNKYVQIHNVLSVNGLATNEVNSICLDEKWVYLATKMGLSKFPSDLKFLINPLKRQVSVNELYVDGRVVYPDSKYLEIASGSKMVQIKLSSTNYKSFGNQKYKYRLLANDKWTYGTSGSIDFYDLTSGEYHLELSYLSDNGIWQKPYEILTIEKHPKFEETIWFYLFLVLASFLVAFLFFRISIVQINKQRNLKRQIEKLEQKALLAQMNPHFIFNSLNSIQSFLVYNENDLAEKYLQMLSQLIRMTLNNSRESEVTIQQEMDVLTKYLELEKMRFKDRFDFQFNSSLAHSELQRYIPPMLIQPFVENSIIHGLRGLEGMGQLTINFKELMNNRLLVEVIDNGIGYPEETKDQSIPTHKSYGMQITSERLTLFKEKYKAEFDFKIEHLRNESGMSKGIKVTLLIPVFIKE